MESISLSIFEYGRQNYEDFIFGAAERYCGEFGLGTPPRSIGRKDGGKPFFSDRSGIFFSLSHSGGFLAVSLSTGEIGVDLQQHRKTNGEAIARRFFHMEEAAYLRGCPDRFFDVWAAKESYVKYTGEGVIRGFGGFSCVENGTFKQKIGDANLSFVPFKKGYSLCICAKKRAPILLKNC